MQNPQLTRISGNNLKQSPSFLYPFFWARVIATILSVYYFTSHPLTLAWILYSSEGLSGFNSIVTTSTGSNVKCYAFKNLKPSQCAKQNNDIVYSRNYGLESITRCKRQVKTIIIR